MAEIVIRSISCLSAIFLACAPVSGKFLSFAFCISSVKKAKTFMQIIIEIYLIHSFRATAAVGKVGD